ncbi:MAG: four helix bundle protein [Bacteroidetes bacterium]|jgi:four helix bundle protein|nr:four helix bundle protein [Bacteroidota bacterium]
MGFINSFKDLIVWQKSMDFVVEVYQFSNGFPIEERYGLTQQLRKAAVSIPSNISEGYGRRSAKDYVRFLEFALGSRNESYTQVILANRLGFLSDEKFMNLENDLEEISKMLVSMIKKIEEK